VLPNIGEEPCRRGRPNEVRQSARAACRKMVDEIRQSLERIRSVEPFRSEPRRRYEYSGAFDAGAAAGDGAVQTLIRDMRAKHHPGTLLKRVNEWLDKLGPVRLMPIKRTPGASGLVELRVKDLESNRWSNYADVGFGIGQALPVLVEGLSTPPGGTLLVQEPEIHLHPDAQLAMASFLVDLIRRNNIRIVVETHSENMLLRFRRAVLAAARGDGRDVPPVRTEDLKIVHVDKKRSGTSVVRVLDVDEMGRVADWPKGFMEDASRERLELLAEMAGD